MKHDSFVVETPERVRFTYHPAESAARAAAFLIDAIIELIIVVLLYLALIGSLQMTRGGIFLALAIVMAFVVQWGYGFLFETLLGGVTPGKALLKLRVVRVDGEPLDLRSIALRNLLRAADGLPLMILPLLGGFVSIADPLSRRLGDLAAGTVVVRDEVTTVQKPHQPYMPEETPINPPRGRRLSEHELYVLRRFFTGRSGMPESRLLGLERSLADKISERLDMPVVEDGTTTAFIAGVYRGHEPVRSMEFAEGREETWMSLFNLVKRYRLSPGGIGNDAGRFIELYRATCADLAAARGMRLSEDVVDYLNALVGEARALVYSLPPLKRGDIPRFLLETLPDRVFANMRFALLAICLFFIPFVCSLAVATRDPSAARRFTNPILLEQMVASYEKADFSGRPVEESSSATSFYIANNISVDFMTMATGVFFGAGSVFFLVENGLTIGSVVGYVNANGAGAAINRFMIAHSVLELSGMALSGAAGLLLGWTLLKAGKTSRAKALRDAMDDFMPLAAAATMLTFIAAFIEAFVSPSTAPVPVRLAVAATSGVAILVYLVVLPLYRRLRINA